MSELKHSDYRYIEEWDEYFLGIAVLVARKSKDPKCQVGAVVASSDKLVLSTGFNGLARGVYDVDDVLKADDEKLKRICHAEFNAIVNAARSGVALKGATIYVTKFPCLSCCNAIVQAGIKRIYTHDHKYWDKDWADLDHTRKPILLKQGGVTVVAPFHPKLNPAHPLTWESLAFGPEGFVGAPSKDGEQPAPDGQSRDQPTDDAKETE